MQLTEIRHGRQIRFNTYGAVDGQSQFEGEVVAVISGRYIEPYTRAQANHANIYPVLPDEVTATITNNATSYDYVQLSYGTNMAYIGLPWIRESTLEEVTVRVATVSLVNFKDPDTTRIRAILESHGYELSSVTLST